MCFRFKAKYHPEECEAKREESKAALKKRAEVFVKLFTSKKVEEVSVDLERQEDLTKLLDAGKDFYISRRYKQDQKNCMFPVMVQNTSSI